MITEVTTPEQIATVAALAETIWTEHYTPIIGTEQVRYMLDAFQSAEAIAKQIADQNCRYYLIESDKTAIGYLGYQKRGTTLFLSKIYLLASYRQLGYGRKALAFLDACAKEMVCDTIELTVNRHNLGSIAAYEKLGFVKSGALVQEIGNGFVMDDWVMRKPV
jgi:RimJ/RimL family protein N-acetyltransferase